MFSREWINFLQFAKYRKYKEQPYRQQLEKVFDYLTFNSELTLSQGSGHYVIAFDPCYVSKSDKKLPALTGIDLAVPTVLNGVWKLVVWQLLILIITQLFILKLYKPLIQKSNPCQIGLAK